MTIRDLLAQENSGVLFYPERFDAVFGGSDIRFWRLGMCSKPLHNADIFTELMLCQQPRDLLALPTVPHY